MRELYPFEIELLELLSRKEAYMIAGRYRKGVTRPRVGMWVRGYLGMKGEEGDYTYKMYQELCSFIDIFRGRKIEEITIAKGLNYLDVEKIAAARTIFGRRPQYDEKSFHGYIYVLKKLGLIIPTTPPAPTREKMPYPKRGLFTKYKLNPEKIDDTSWYSPYMVYRFNLPYDKAVEKWKEVYAERRQQVYPYRRRERLAPSRPRGRPRKGEIPRAI